MPKRLQDVEPGSVMRALVVTVGGSAQPIVKALMDHKPDYTVYICSPEKTSPRIRGSALLVEGEGNKVCSDGFGSPPSLPNIRVQAEVEDQPYDILIVDRVDDLAQCCEVAWLAFDHIRSHSPRAEIVVDYTGGTKTMAAGLALASVDAADDAGQHPGAGGGSIRMTVVSGDRPNLIRVDDNANVLAMQDIVSIQVRRVVSRTRSLAREYDYAAVQELVNGFVSRFSAGAAQEGRIRALSFLANGFEAWDRFDHLTAFQTLKRFWRCIPDYMHYLEAICAARAALDPTFDIGKTGRSACDGYEIVDDLVYNALRRAHGKRYDDAVGRLYRASEMLVQIHLKQAYGIDSGDIDVSKLPEGARDFLIPDPASGRVKAPHRIAYDLLQHFPNDPLYAVFSARRGAFLSALNLRNASLFAHGFKPIERPDFRRVNEVLGGIVRDGLAAVVPQDRKVKARQLPTDLIRIADSISGP